MINDYSYCNEIDGCIEQLRRCETISEHRVKMLCDKAAEIISVEDNVLYLNSPITVK
jgi:serine/threonine-protein phosphatase 4 catalytic subunit